MGSFAAALHVAILACWVARINSFTPCTRISVQSATRPSPLALPPRLSSSSSNEADPPPPNLVNKDAFVAAIETLKADAGIPTDPAEAEVPKMHAIGKLVANLPIELAGGISLADCDTLTLVNGLTQQVANVTGIRALDTIVSISAGGDGGYHGSTKAADLDATAGVYTAAIEHALANKLKEIELEVNRLVTLQASAEL